MSNMYPVRLQQAKSMLEHAVAEQRWDDVATINESLADLLRELPQSVWKEQASLLHALLSVYEQAIERCRHYRHATAIELKQARQGGQQAASYLKTATL